MSRSPALAARVAIVDSRPSDYDNLLNAASDADVSVHFMRTGNEALRFLRRWHAGLWVINTQLDDMTGFDLAQMLRGMRPNAMIFIIGNEYRLDDEMQTLTLGLTKYVCKPLEPSWVIPHGDGVCIPLRVFQDVRDLALDENVAAHEIHEQDVHAPDVHEVETVNILSSGLEVVGIDDEEMSATQDQEEPMILKFDPRFRRRPAA